MHDERMAHTILAISQIFENVATKDGSKPHWFVSFGTLLWFVRDRLLQRPFEQDFDISLIYGQAEREDLMLKFEDYGYKLDHEVLVDGKIPLQMTFKPLNGSLWPADIDLFFWVIGDKYAWHTYREMVKDGECTFKATPKDLILAETVSEVWDPIAPAVNFPTRYGSLFDEWYPPQRGPDGKFVPYTTWRDPIKQYGQSRTRIIKTIQNYKNMEKDLG